MLLHLLFDPIQTWQRYKYCFLTEEDGFELRYVYLFTNDVVNIMLAFGQIQSHFSGTFQKRF